MVEVIINRKDNTITIDSAGYSRCYIFRSISKNNNSVVPTYVFHVNDDDLLNIKIVVPQCKTMITEIPNK